MNTFTSKVFVFLCSILASALLALDSMPSWANPEGGTVAAGEVTMSHPADNVLQVNQSSQKAIVNWQSFNIGQQEHVNFQQPNHSSIILNRVNPYNGVSKIFGTMSANGQVWLINPAGIWIGPTAHINVAGLLATTADIKDADFLKGYYHFQQSSEWNSAVVNEGTIVIHDAGLAALAGPGVVNNGRIEAHLGTVVLAAGKEFTVDFNGDQLINFKVGSATTEAPIDPRTGNRLSSAVENTGRIIADGGKVLMTAQTAGHILDSAINMSGIVEARSVGMRNGEIILDGHEDTVYVSGRLIASGRRRGQTGGTVKVLGKQVALLDNADIEVSGDVGGGEILVGGNAHGQGPEANAAYAYVGPKAVLNASALTAGNGGKVVVWSDLGTQFYGNILARGGNLSGNGGWVETSGEQYLDAEGSVDASAPAGQGGNWLLDPANVTISSSATTNGTFSGGSPNVFSTTANSAVANTTTIQNSLNSGTSVTINTTPAGSQDGDITVSSTITKSAGSTATLTLNAGSGGAAPGVININQAITSTTGALNVTLAGQGTITLGAGITTNGGAFNASVQSTGNPSILQTAGTINTGSGSLTFSVPTTTTGSIGTSSSPILTTSTGTLTITAGSGGAFISNTGSLTLATPTLNTNSPLTVLSSGTLTLPAAAISTGTGSIDLESNGGTLTTRGTLTTTSGDIKLVASGLLTINNNLTTGSGTANGITLTGTGVTQASSVVVNAGAGTASPGNIMVNAGTGTLTLNSGSRLLAGNSSGTAGKITLTADSMSFNTSGTPSQIGGTGSGAGFAQYTILQPSTASRTIGIAGGSGSLSLSAAALNDVRAKNVRIGSNTGTGAMTINAWTPGANFASGGVLTLDTGGGITEGGVLSLATDGASLIVRSGAGSGAVSLTQANVFTSVAASLSNSALSITNASNKPLTISSLTDDLGTVSGITTPANVTLTTSGTSGSLTLNQGINTSSGSGTISLNSVASITQAANTTVNAGSGNILYSAGTGSITTNSSDLLLTTGAISLSADTMSLASDANSQIGGTGLGAGSAQTAIVTVGDNSVTVININPSGSPAGLDLSLASLNSIHATNVRIGGPAVVGGQSTPTIEPNGITIGNGSGNWMPASTFANNGVLTLEMNGDLTQTAGLILPSTTGLLLRDYNNATLTNTANVINNFAANAYGAGSLQITDAANQSLTLTSLSDDETVGSAPSPVAGITVTGGDFTAGTGVTLTTSGTGAININQSINQGITGVEFEVVLNSGSGGVSAANGVSINSGTSPITINGGGGAVNLGTSTFTNTNNTSTALQLLNASTVALGNISLTGGSSATATLGTGANPITGAVTQNASTTIAAPILTGTTSNSVNLSNSGNTITHLAAMTTSGALNVTDSASLLTVTGNVSSNNNAITLAGIGYTQNASTTVNAGSGNLSISSGTGTLTLNAASNLYSTGTITLTDDVAAFNAAAVIGGTGTGNAASNLIIQQSTSARTIGIAGGAGNLSLPSSAFTGVHATNVQIGNSASGAVAIGSTSTPATWTPVSTFATNLLLIESGASIVQNASNSLNLQTSGSNLTLEVANPTAGAGTLTLNSTLLVGNGAGTTGTINLLADSMTFNAVTQIGGTATGIGFAKYVIIQPFTAGTVMSVGGGSTGLQLTSAMLNTIRSTNLRIGSINNTGGIAIGSSWSTPGTNFNSGVLTLDTSGGISQTGALTLGTNLPSLLLRDSNNIALASSSSNALTTISTATTSGGALSGPTQIKSVNALTIASLTDDLGSTAGLSTTGNATLTSSSSISESGSAFINAALLTTSSAGGTNLGNANTISSFNAANITSGGINLTNTAAPLTITGISQSGGGNVSVANTGGMTTSGAITTTGAGSVSLTATGAETIGSGGITTGTSGGAVNLTAGANNLLTITGNVASNGGAITYTADNMTLTGTTNSGAGLVTLTPVSNVTAIQLGVGAVNSTGVLGINNTQLGTITSTGGLTIGSNTNTGGITVVGTASP